MFLGIWPAIVNWVPGPCRIFTCCLVVALGGMGVEVGGTGVGGTGVGEGADVAVGGVVGVAGTVGLGVGVAVAVAPHAVANKTNSANVRTNRVLRVFIENLLNWVHAVVLDGVQFRLC